MQNIYAQAKGAVVVVVVMVVEGMDIRQRLAGLPRENNNIEIDFIHKGVEYLCNRVQCNYGIRCVFCKCCWL